VRQNQVIYVVMYDIEISHDRFCVGYVMQLQQCHMPCLSFVYRQEPISLFGRGTLLMKSPLLKSLTVNF
jgi:hypothetical protein